MKKSLSLILALAVLATICLSGFGVQAEDISVLRAKVIPYAEIDQAMVVNDSIPVPEADRGKVKGEVNSGYAEIPHYTDGYNLELVDSPIGFFEETQVLQCDTPVERAVEIDSLTYPTSYTAYPPFNMMFLEESLDGVQEIMFYVKMPAGKANCIGFTLCIMANGEIVYPLMDIWKPFYYLEKGTREWVRSLNVTPRSVINLEEGFEGYIRIPLSSFNNNIKSWQWDEDGAILRRIQVTAPRNFGGDAGPWYISPLMLCENGGQDMPHGVILDGETTIRNLFTGEEMTEEDLKPPKPEIGETVSKLPGATTTDYEIDIPVNKTESSTLVTWDAMPGAAKYIVDVYLSSFATSGISYIYQQTQTVSDNSVTLQGLQKQNRYYVVVTAFDSNDQELAVYQYLSFVAGELEDEDYDDDFNGENDDDTDSGAEDVPTGEPASIIPVFMLISCLAILVLSFKKEEDKGKLIG